MEHPTLVATLAAAAVLAACGDGQDPIVPGSPTVLETTRTATVPTTPTAEETSQSPREAAGERIEITVSDGQVQGPGTVILEAGTEVELVVTSDVADHIHVHGYDLFEEVAAGGTATLTFTADLPGTWEIELEDSGTHLVELQVRG